MTKFIRSATDFYRMDADLILVLDQGKVVDKAPTRNLAINTARNAYSQLSKEELEHGK